MELVDLDNYDGKNTNYIHIIESNSEDPGIAIVDCEYLSEIPVEKLIQTDKVVYEQETFPGNKCLRMCIEKNSKLYRFCILCKDVTINIFDKKDRSGVIKLTHNGSIKFNKSWEVLFPDLNKFYKSFAEHMSYDGSPLFKSNSDSMSIIFRNKGYQWKNKYLTIFDPEFQALDCNMFLNRYKRFTGTSLIEIVGIYQEKSTGISITTNPLCFVFGRTTGSALDYKIAYENIISLSIEPENKTLEKRTKKFIKFVECVYSGLKV